MSNSSTATSHHLLLLHANQTKSLFTSVSSPILTNPKIPISSPSPYKPLISSNSFLFCVSLSQKTSNKIPAKGSKRRSNLAKMADRHPGQPQTQATQRPTTTTTTRNSGPAGGGGGGTAFLRRFQEHAPNSTQMVGFLTLVVSGGILLFLTGLTITATVLGLLFFTPLIVLSSPIWVPAGTVLFVAVAGFLSMCGFGVAVLAGGSWMYKYFNGRHPPGSDRVDYARSRIADTASHMKDYAREYSGYLQSKVKDAAPGA